MDRRTPLHEVRALDHQVGAGVGDVDRTRRIDRHEAYIHRLGLQRLQHLARCVEGDELDRNG